MGMVHSVGRYNESSGAWRGFSFGPRRYLGPGSFSFAQGSFVAFSTAASDRLLTYVASDPGATVGVIIPSASRRDHLNACVMTTDVSVGWLMANEFAGGSDLIVLALRGR